MPIDPADHAAALALNAGHHARDLAQQLKDVQERLAQIESVVPVLRAAPEMAQNARSDVRMISEQTVAIERRVRALEHELEVLRIRTRSAVELGEAMDRQAASSELFPDHVLATEPSLQTFAREHQELMQELEPDDAQSRPYGPAVHEDLMKELRELRAFSQALAVPSAGVAEAIGAAYHANSSAASVLREAVKTAWREAQEATS